MNPDANRNGSVAAGVAAGLAGLATFLVLHHVWIVPIWFIAPAGAVMATGGGAVVGAAYSQLLPHLPARPLTPIAVAALVGLILLPAVVIAELRGPIRAMSVDGGGWLVPPAQAIAAFGLGLLATATITGASLGWLITRTPAGAGWTACAGFLLALGPGHNIPFFGGTPAAPKEFAILGAVVVVAAAVQVEGQAWRARRDSNARCQPS